MCMCKSGIGRWVKKICWLITGLAALNIGLAAAHVFDVNSMNFMANPHTKMIVDYIVGVAGALSLIDLIGHGYHCMSGTCQACQMNQPH